MGWLREREAQLLLSGPGGVRGPPRLAGQKKEKKENKMGLAQWPLAQVAYKPPRPTTEIKELKRGALARLGLEPATTPFSTCPLNHCTANRFLKKTDTQAR